MRKSMLTSDQLVQHMIEKGIHFTIISEEDAKRHLSENNNYFKLTSYRKNYSKITTGMNAGQYENLEFAYLRELARLDTAIRHLLLEMALDIEHFLKVCLLDAVEDQMVNGEDGYAIVSDYVFDSNNQNNDSRAENVSKRSREFHLKIAHSQSNPYCGGLVRKYADEMPIWAYIELISFGDLKDLIDFYSRKTRWKPPVDIKSLDRVRQLRNACAHGNAIINDLKPAKTNENSSVAPKFITEFVARAGVSKTTRDKKLSNPRINQIVHLLYVYDKVVIGEYTRTHRIEELKNLMDRRILENKEFFGSNDLLVSTYEFFKKIIENVK